jgi:DNA ligase-1
MQFNQTVYKKDSKGKLRIKIISADNGEVIQESGLDGGKLVRHTSIAKPKNVGKTNETSSRQQAYNEAKALIVKNLKEGYYETLEETEQIVILPMLADKYHEQSDKIDWTDAYVQPKLDGMRCLDTLNGKISRKNTPIETMGHIEVIRPTGITCAVDGELYRHGSTFQENMSIIKKVRPGTSEVKHHVYDVVSELPFIDRYIILSEIVKESTNLVLVPTFKVNSLEDVTKFHAQFIEDGYEGSMIRWGSEGYKVNARSIHLLKFKDFLDETYEIVDVLPSDKNPEQGVVQCVMPDGQTFGCGMKFSHGERKEFLNNKG